MIVASEIAPCQGDNWAIFPLPRQPGPINMKQLTALSHFTLVSPSAFLQETLTKIRTLSFWKCRISRLWIFRAPRYT